MRCPPGSGQRAGQDGELPGARRLARWPTVPPARVCFQGGKTALFLAVWARSVELVELLLERGARADSADDVELLRIILTGNGDSGLSLDTSDEEDRAGGLTMSQEKGAISAAEPDKLE